MADCSSQTQRPESGMAGEAANDSSDNKVLHTAASVTSVSDNQDNSDNVTNTEQHPEKTMSKNQLKKLKKRQRYMEVKSQRRQEEKGRRKVKRREALQRGEDLGPSRKKLKQNTMETSSCRISVVIDCSFDDLMTEKDVCKMVQQIQHTYSANRRAEHPMQLYVTSVGGKCQSRLDYLGDHNNWDVHFKPQSYESLFDKSQLVYLSSDSDNVLQTLEEDKVYIIGGLVDHNHHKGLCHTRAVEKGLVHAQLPITNYLDMKTRKVLTVNQVFEILLRYTETHDWEKAFFTAIPKRKGAVVRPGTQGDDGAAGGSECERQKERETEDSETGDGSSCDNDSGSGSKSLHDETGIKQSVDTVPASGTSKEIDDYTETVVVAEKKEGASESDRETGDSVELLSANNNT